MKETFFEIIDTKVKAYWLGFLYAEGYIETRNQKPYRLGIEIGRDDEILIDKFIEAIDIDPERKHYRERDHTFLVKFVNKQIVNDLVKLGVVPRKSKIIELPDLNTRELYLAFLLGFYDGDGKTGYPRIFTGSRKFLEQIKNKFKLKYKIYERSSSGYYQGRLIKSHGYSMSIGVKLFNEMIANYQESLPRKRRLVSYNEKLEIIRNSSDLISTKKFKITKEELEDLVWKMPLTKIGANYGVNSRTVKYWCIKWGISTPPLGYWARQSKNRKKKRNKEEEKQTDENLQENYDDYVYEGVNQKVPEGNKKEIEKTSRENQPSEKKKKFENIIHERKQEHPFDKRFNEKVKEDNYSDMDLWISPKVREDLEREKTILKEKLMENAKRKDDILNIKESRFYAKRNDLEPEISEKGLSGQISVSIMNINEQETMINPEISSEIISNNQGEKLPDIMPIYPLWVGT
ncbi:MAG: hypothetical protein ACFFG0_10365 [Candidatus Thorarchaeota archaeon]